MKNKVTVILSIVFLLLIGVLLALYTGILQSPFASSPPLLPPHLSINKNTNTTPKNLIKRTPNTTYDAAMKDGDTYFKSGYYGDAVEEYIRASQLEKNKLDPYLKLGESYLLMDDYDQAYENLTYVLEKDPNNESAKILLAKTYIKKSEFASALDIFLSLDPENQEVRYYIGILRAQQGEIDKALNNLSKSVTINPDSPLAQKANSTVANIQEFNLFTDGKSIHLRTLIARSMIQNGEYQIAISMLKDVLKENKNYRDAWLLLGFSYYLVQKYDYALETLTTAYDLDPEKPETQYFLGLTHMKLENNEKALTFLILALKNGFEPRSDVQRKMADLYLINKNYDEALSTYLDIIKEGKTNDINQYVRPIWIYIDIKKQPIEAINLAKQSHERFPEDAMGYNLIGWAALANDDLETARTNLEEAMKRDPNIQAVYLNLGDLYTKENDIEKAKDYYKRAYFIDKNSSIGNLAASKYNSLQSSP